MRTGGTRRLAGGRCAAGRLSRNQAQRGPQTRGQRGAHKAISIQGLTEGISYHLGQCCHPLPGDRIVGLMVPGEGVVIHTIDCEELERAQSSMADWLDVRWDTNAAQSDLSVARILIRAKNAPGSLAALATVIGNNGGNIFNLKIANRSALTFEFLVDVEVRDVAHLQNILGALRVNAAVESVERLRGPQTGPEGIRDAGSDPGRIQKSRRASRGPFHPVVGIAFRHLSCRKRSCFRMRSARRNCARRSPRKCAKR
jgi:hypothetical protein